jgi:tetratricopeptide (TPR) repeat protein
MSLTAAEGIVNTELIQGRRVCVTGRLVSMTHADLADLIKACGGKFLHHPRRCGFLLVVGDDGWPSDHAGAPTAVFYRSRQLQARGYPIEFITEEDFLERLGLTEPAGAIRGHHTIGDLSRILNIAPTKIRRWMRVGLIQPVESNYRLAAFDFHQVANAKRLCELLESGASLSAIRKGLDQMRRWLRHKNLPLSQLVQLEQGTVVLRVNGDLMESSGQRLLDFEEQSRHAVTLAAPRPDQAPSADAFFDLALELEDAGRLNESAEVYRQALQMEPTDPVLHFNMGNVLFRLGCFVEAVASFEAALRYDPQYAEAWNNLGNTHAELHNWDQAIHSFQRALQFIPNYADAHYNLADIYKRLGKTRESSDHLAAYRRYSTSDRLRNPRTEILRLISALDNERSR